MTDTLKPDIVRPLPHFRARTEKIKYIIIHCSRSTPEKQWQTLNELGLSVHYIIGRDASLTQALSPEQVAYHAGISSWKKSPDKSLNGTSIGIELEAPNMGQLKTDYTIKQINKLIKLLKQLTNQYKIPKKNILAHSDIAPSRKPDPGVCFPWHRLAKHNLAITSTKVPPHTPIKPETYYLKKIGYNIENLPAARYAFCRRFLAQEVRIIKDLQYLVDNPYPKDFTPSNMTRYLKRLQEVTKAFEY